LSIQQLQTFAQELPKPVYHLLLWFHERTMAEIEVLAPGGNPEMAQADLEQLKA